MKLKKRSRYKSRFIKIYNKADLKKSANLKNNLTNFNKIFV